MGLASRHNALPLIPLLVNCFKCFNSRSLSRRFNVPWIFDVTANYRLGAILLQLYYWKYQMSWLLSWIWGGWRNYDHDDDKIEDDANTEEGKSFWRWGWRTHPLKRHLRLATLSNPNAKAQWKNRSFRQIHLADCKQIWWNPPQEILIFYVCHLKCWWQLSLLHWLPNLGKHWWRFDVAERNTPPSNKIKPKK